MTNPVKHTPPETMDWSEKGMKVREKIAEIRKRYPEEYARQDPTVMHMIDRVYREAYGTGTVIVNPETVEIPTNLGGD